MGRKDTLTKEYMSRNDIFADIFNYILFDGRMVIQLEDLMERDITEIALPIGKDGRIVPAQRYRDILKGIVFKEKGETIYALLGIETQSEPHYAMPVKNLLYDAINYAAQVDQRAAEYRKERKELKNHKIPMKESSAEFLSGFHKEDKLKRVITVTVYFGTEDWDAPRNIRDRFPVSDLECDRFLLDYPIPLIIPKEISDFGKFHSEFGYVMQIIGASGDDMEMDNLLSQMRDDGVSLSRTAVEILNQFIGLSVMTSKKEENVSMGKICKALQDIRQKAAEEGRRSGRAEERRIIASQTKKEGFSPEVIARILQLSESSV